MNVWTDDDPSTRTRVHWSEIIAINTYRATKRKSHIETQSLKTIDNWSTYNKPGKYDNKYLLTIKLLYSAPSPTKKSDVEVDGNGV